MRFIVTAGPTREYLDPVRFLSNPSTGKMGFAVARAAAERGHDVTLIAGPVSLKTPKGVKRVDVVSAREMLAASLSAIMNYELRMTNGGRIDSCKRESANSVIHNSSFVIHNYPTFFISTAAVADWRPAKCAAKKLKKSQMSDTLRLVRNPDILKTIKEKFKLKGKGQVQERTGKLPLLTSNLDLDLQPSPLDLDLQPRPSPLDLDLQPRPSPLDLAPSPLHLVGFAAETNDMLAEASRKCREKGLSFIVANDVTQKGSGFGTDTNRVTFVFPDGTTRRLPLMSKHSVARRIVRQCETLG